jgi:hypothetical protein
VAGSPAVQITLAGVDGATFEAGDPRLGELWRGIDACRSHSTPLYIQGYRRVDVSCGAAVKLTPGLELEAVSKSITAALDAEFGFEPSRFGGVLSAAAVVSVMQRVAGVVAVDFDGFAWPGMQPGDDPRERRASGPAWDTSDPAKPKLLAAELVILRPPSLRTLEVATI